MVLGALFGAHTTQNHYHSQTLAVMELLRVSSWFKATRMVLYIVRVGAEKVATGAER